MTTENLSIRAQEKRFWQLKDQIVIELNQESTLLRGRTGVRVTHHIDGPEIWEMILNKDGQWPGVSHRSGVEEPTLSELLECYAGLQDLDFMAQRRLAKTLEDYNHLRHTYLKKNKRRLLSHLIGAMETSLEGLER